MSWMRGYKPEELFDKNGALVAELADLPPKGRRRMGMNPAREWRFADAAAAPAQSFASLPST